MGAGLCDGEGERAYTEYDPILGEEKYLIYFNASREYKPDTGQSAKRQYAETQFAESEEQFAKTYSAQCP